MKTKLITYNLTGDNIKQDTSSVISYCKSFPKWAKPLPNVWLIKTDKGSGIIRDEINKVIGGRGQILVIDVTNSGWGTLAISKEVTTWMKENV